jgi:D-amino-acid dehydrogenase
VKVEFLSGDEARELEPLLGNTVAHAVLLPETRSVADPYGFTQQLMARFMACGGRFEQALVTDIHVRSGYDSQVVTTSGSIRADIVVLAAGAESAHLAHHLGVSVPLQAERGYHLMLDGAEALQTPIVSGEFRFGIVRLFHGARIVAGSELAAPKDPPDFRRIHRLLPMARRLVPSLGNAIARRWVGARPSMPDSLPVIMRSPASPRVLLAFGHGHLGLTLGAYTGRLICRLAVSDAASPACSTWPRPYAGPAETAKAGNEHVSSTGKAR